MSIRNELAALVTAQRCLLTQVQRTHSGEPLNFIDWPFLEAIYKDESPDIVIKSCVKSGKSEWLIATDFALCMLGMNVLHVLPDLKVRDRFVQARTDPTILNTPNYYNIVVDKPVADQKRRVNKVTLKQVGTSWLNYIGSNSTNEFTEYVADAWITDEYDKCHQRNLAMAPDRMDASDLKLKIAVGNPSIKGYGIAQLYEETDKKEWHIVCRSCGEAQPLDFFVNVVEVNKDDSGNVVDYHLRDRDCRVLCRSCGGVLDRLEREPGFAYWSGLATDHGMAPANPRSGYHISQLYSPKVTIQELWEKLTAAKDVPWKLQAFFNSNLGLESTPEGAAITEDMLTACIEPNYHMPNKWDAGAGFVTAGIDIGIPNYIRISDVNPHTGQRRMIYSGTITGWKDLYDLLQRFSVHVAVIDAQPEANAAEEWQQDMKDKGLTVWRCQTGITSEQSVKGLIIDPDLGLVQLNRTAMLDKSTSEWRQQLHILPVEAPYLDDGEYYIHMQENVRLTEEDAKGNPIARWSKGRDHYRFADAFDCIARKLPYTTLRTDSIMSTGRMVGASAKW